MASSGIKRLRILTGTHVGACLDLEPGEHTLGRHHDSDIAISDWTEPTMHLLVGGGARDAVQGRWSEPERASASAADAAPDEPVVSGGGEHVVDLVDFEPRAFGDIVVCTGPLDTAWPSDMELLGAAFRPPPAAPDTEPRWTRSTLRKVGALAFSGGIVLVAAVWASMGFMQASSQAAGVPLDSPARVEDSLRQTVVRIGGPSLRVENVQGSLLVSGLLESREQAHALREAIAALPRSVPIHPRFAVAQELAEGIRSGVGLPDAQVTYVGGGVFVYSADSPDPVATRAALARLAVDLGPSVKRIDMALQPNTQHAAERAALAEKNKGTGPLMSAFTDGEVSVTQTRDGAKHITVAPVLPPVSPMAAPPAPPVPSPIP